MNNIPKIIHQVWVGPHPIPKPMQDCIETVKKHHPDWEYHLWTDDNLKEDFCLYEELRGDHCEEFKESETGTSDDLPPSSRISDVVRLGVLWQYGGVYLDTDMEAVKPIDKLLEGFEFIIGEERPGWKGCAILASAPNGTFLETPMRLVKERHTPEGIEEMKRIKAFNGQKFGGPAMWNDAAQIDREMYESSDSLKVYPSEYFYPHDCNSGREMTDWEIPSNTSDFHPNLHMIHHFALSWFWDSLKWEKNTGVNNA